MAKQVLELNNFAGGLNAYSDARDIGDLEFAQNWNAVVSKAGIIKVAGMALPEIETEYITNENFQDGRGLFQFSSDYSLSVMGSNFDIGLTSGTRSGSNSTTSHTLEDKQSLSSIDNFYQNMIMFITEGTGVGESRIITAFNKDTRVLTTEAFSVSLDTTSKYIIYSWKLDGASWSGKDGDAKKDFITDGTSSSMLQTLSGFSNQDFNSKYFIFSKVTNIGDEQSKNLGYIEYASNITLIPGTEYTLYFDCAAKQQFHNLISDGDVDPSDGAVSHGDKLPWVQLHSTTVADTQGSIRGLANTQVTVDDGGVSSAWTDGQTYLNQSPSSTSSGTGEGATFNIVTSASGATLNFHIQSRGSGYQDNDVLTFINPDDTTKIASITVNEINITGLALYDNGHWKSGIAGNDATSKYISYVDNNYIDNGDFKDFNSSEVSGATDNSWVIGSNTTAVRESSLMYGGDIGTLRLKRNESGSILLPHTDSFSAYAYQSVQLDENTLYHLNFLYDAVVGQGLAFFVYNKTKEQYAPGYSPFFLPHTRSSLDNPFYRFPAARQLSFYTGHAKLSSSTQKEEYYIGFAASQSGEEIATNFSFSPSTLIERINVRLAGVTLYKAHNDLASMSNSLNTDLLSNPYKQTIKAFSTYSTKFTVPKNYTTVSDWKLRFYAGHFGYRDGNTFGLTNTQEVYFDNFILSEQTGVSNANIGNAVTSDGPDTITAITNNRLDKSEIVLHSSKSNILHKNMIQWDGLNCQPVFNYVNGFLKISDGNFNNFNSNKLLYYTDIEGISRDGKKGWISQDSIFDNITAPTLTQSFLQSDIQILDEGVDCISLLNNLYNHLSSSNVSDNIANETTENNKHAGAHAAWYGKDNVQGYVHMYYFNSNFRLKSSRITVDDVQVMIPRFADLEGNRNLFYSNTLDSFIDLNNQLLLESSPLGVGGYQNESQELNTGTVDNVNTDTNFNNLMNIVVGSFDLFIDVFGFDFIPGGTEINQFHLVTSDSLNYPRVNTFGVNRLLSSGNYSNDSSDFQTAEVSSRKLVTNFIIPNSVVQQTFNNNIPSRKMEIEFEYEVFGYHPNGLGAGNNSMTPRFKIDVFLIEDEISEDLLNNVNINRNNQSFIDITANATHSQEKLYGYNWTGNATLITSIISFDNDSDGDGVLNAGPNKFIRDGETGRLTHYSFKEIGTTGKDLSIQMKIKDIIDLPITSNSNIAISITKNHHPNFSLVGDIETNCIIEPLTQESEDLTNANTYVSTDAETRSTDFAFFSRIKICKLNLGGFE